MTCVFLAFQCQTQHAQNTVEWCANFVAHACQKVGPGASSANSVFLGADQRPVTAQQSFILFRYLPGAVLHFPFQLAGIVFHGAFGGSQLGHAHFHVFQVLVDDAHHGADFITFVVFRNRKPDFLRRTCTHLTEGVDDVHHGPGQHKIENGEQYTGERKAFQQPDNQGIGRPGEKLYAVMIGVDGYNKLAQRQIRQLRHLQFLIEHAAGAKQQIADPAIAGNRAALAGCSHGLAIAVNNSGVYGGGVLQEAVEQLLREPDINVIGNLGGRALADFNQGANFAVHRFPGGEVVQGNLDQVQYQAQHHGDQDRVPGEAIGEPLPDSVKHDVASSLRYGRLRSRVQSS